MIIYGLGSLASNAQDFSSSTYVEHTQSLIIEVPLAHRYNIKAIAFDITPINSDNNFPLIARAMIRRGRLRAPMGWCDPMFSDYQTAAYGENPTLYPDGYNTIFDRDVIWQAGASTFGSFFYSFGERGIAKSDNDKYITALLTPAYRADAPIVYRESVVTCLRTISLLGEEK